jgi:hypothetical protein
MPALKSKIVQAIFIITTSNKSPEDYNIYDFDFYNIQYI